MARRAMFALVLAGLWFVGAAAVATTAQAYPATTCATLSVSSTSPTAGDSLAVTGANFSPNASITLDLQGPTTRLGTVTADAQGAFSTSVTLPSGTTGSHRLVASGGLTAGCSAPTVSLDIAAASTGASSGGGTAVTGVDIAAMIAVALGLIIVGVVLQRRAHARKLYTGER